MFLISCCPLVAGIAETVAAQGLSITVSENNLSLFYTISSQQSVQQINGTSVNGDVLKILYSPN